MEYIIQLEERRRYWLLGIGIFLACLFIFFSNKFLGLYGFALSVGLVFFTLLTPLLYGKYAFFLFLWLVVLPFSSLLPIPNISGIVSPVAYLLTGISFPYVLLMFFQDIEIVVKHIPFVKYLIIFLVVTLFGLFSVNASFISVMQQFRVHILEVFLVALTFFYIRKHDSNKILNWINIVALGNALISIFQKLTGHGIAIIEGIPRVQGFMGHPNSCGFFVNIYLPIGLYLFLKENNKKKKLFYGISILLNILTLVLTLSKTSLLIFGLLLLILFSLLQSRDKIKVVILSLLMTVLFIFVEIFFKLGILNSVMNRFSDQGSLIWRFNTWKLLIDNMTWKSYLIGNGPDSVFYYLISVRPNEASTSHNGYLQLLYEYGILGLSYIYAIISVFIKTTKSILKNNNSTAKTDLLVLFAISMVLLLELSVEQATVCRPIMYSAWTIITIFYLKVYNINILYNQLDYKLQVKNV
jgi:O-antigen ligase